MPAIHLLGRVALISNGHILLTHEIGAENTFLPGGHLFPFFYLKKVLRKGVAQTISRQSSPTASIFLPLLNGMASSTGPG